VVFLVRPDGSSLRRLIVDGKDADWAPDGRRIAFERLPAGDYHPGVNVAAIGRRSSSDPTARVGAVKGGDPAWSTDGSSIAFSGNSGDDLSDTDIFTIGADGHDLRRLTHSPDDRNTDPSWSPDGRRIAYERGPSEQTIRVMNADGGNDHKVASGGSPAWSPDGKWIAYEDEMGDGIVLVKEDGTERHRLGVFGFDPAWSPDGRWIAYVTHKVGTADPYDLYVMRRDGSGARRIARNAASPSWQPLPK
jgi:TolB protein